MRRAEAWVLERLNGEDGLGAIFPAMVNALEMMVLLGYPADDPRRVTAKRAIQKLLVDQGDRAYCQPCVSPVWDTALAALAMQEAGDSQATRAARCVGSIGSFRGRCWRMWATGARSGRAYRAAAGRFSSPMRTIPTSTILPWSPGPCIRRDCRDRYTVAIERAVDWLVGMQSENGGFAAFDADNTHYNLNYIPFADHGALLDPPTSDVTARVVAVLSRVARPQDRAALERAVVYLRREQEADGSWFGRWGSNYIYGTWSVLVALELAGIPADDPAVRRAVEWFSPRGRMPTAAGARATDGYELETHPDTNFPQHAVSDSVGIAWAHRAAGEGDSPAVKRGVDHLLRTQESSGLWSHPTFTLNARLPAGLLSQVSRLQRLLSAFGRLPPIAPPQRGVPSPLKPIGIVSALAAGGAHSRGGGSSGRREASPPHGGRLVGSERVLGRAPPVRPPRADFVPRGVPPHL